MSFSSRARDEIYVSYTVTNLCKGATSILYCDVFSCDLTLHPHRPLMNQSLVALATVFYGLQNRASGTVKDGIQRYGLALSMLRKVLGTDESNITTEITVSVFMLGMLEVLNLVVR